MQIVELSGLPGCGKSTLLALVKQRFEKEGYQVYTFEEIMKDGPLFRGAFLSFQIQRIKPSIRNNVDRIQRFYSDFPYDKKREYFMRTLLELYARLLVVCGKKAKAVVLLDEGILQYLSSIPYDVLIDEKLLTKDQVRKLISCIDKYVIVDCRVPLEEDIRRLKARNRENDRYCRLDEEQLLRTLNVKQENLDYLRSSLTTQDSFTISMTESPEENTEIFWKEYTEKYEEG